jgi:trigger factor
VRSSVESVEPTRVKITVVVEPDELRPAIDRTVQRLSNEIKVPGFRKGKVPRQVMEARLGKKAIVAEAIEHEAVPEFYTRALQELEIVPLTRAQVDLPDYSEGPLEFSATVEVKPELKLPPYRGVEVSKPVPEVREELVDARLDQLRNQVAQLEVIGRPLQSGDFATIDLRTTHHDQELEQLSQADFLYEVGSGQLVPELDEELIGKRKGDILKVNVTLPEEFGEDLAGKDVTMTVLVKETKAKVLPALDDDFAQEASEFDTVDELRADIRSKLETVANQQAAAELETRVLETYLNSAEVPLPESMVAEEMRFRLSRVAERLQAMNVPLERYLETTGTSAEQFQADIEAQARRAVKAQLVLESVAKAEHLEATPEEVDAEIERQARRLGQDPARVRKVFEGSRAGVIRGDILRSKALALMVETANATEPTGQDSTGSGTEGAPQGEEAGDVAAGDAGAGSSAASKPADGEEQ